jgi:hypothetical protein
LCTLIASTACVRSAGNTGTQIDKGAYLTFRNQTEDEVRVFIFEGEKPWFVGNVQAFRGVRLRVPTDLAVHSGQLVYMAAVPVGGRGRFGDPATGAVIRSDAEQADHVAQFEWTLVGQTLSAALPPRRPR